MSETPVLEAKGLTKRFPGVLANDHVDLTLYKGEVLSLLGENGAGKTTLMNMLYGLYHPDLGEIEVNGQPIQMDSPNEAIQAGIGMVHQHFMLVQVMSVTENIMLGLEETRGFNIQLKGITRNVLAIVVLVLLLGLLFVMFQLPSLINVAIIGLLVVASVLVVLIGILALIVFPLLRRMNRSKVAARIQELSESYNLAVNPNDTIQDLPVGIQQRVEIIKALYRNADILILDEPTAVLTPQETEELFEIIRNLTKQGTSIIFINHKLKEVLEISDRISVLHRGSLVGTVSPDEATEASLAEMMVGRKVILQVDKTPADPKESVLVVEELYAKDDRKQSAVNGVTLEVRAGEILGVAGVQGNGQREFVEALTGLRPAEAVR